jgi:hypothetical protein
MPLRGGGGKEGLRTSPSPRQSHGAHLILHGIGMSRALDSLMLKHCLVILPGNTSESLKYGLYLDFPWINVSRGSMPRCLEDDFRGRPSG